MDALIRHFVHDIRNRLTVAEGFIDLVVRGRYRAPESRQDEWLGFAREAVSEIDAILVALELEVRRKLDRDAESP